MRHAVPRLVESATPPAGDHHTDKLDRTACHQGRPGGRARGRADHRDPRRVDCHHHHAQSRAATIYDVPSNTPAVEPDRPLSEPAEYAHPSRRDRRGGFPRREREFGPCREPSSVRMGCPEPTATCAPRSKPSAKRGGRREPVRDDSCDGEHRPRPITGGRHAETLRHQRGRRDPRGWSGARRAHDRVTTRDVLPVGRVTTGVCPVRSVSRSPEALVETGVRCRSADARSPPAPLAHPPRPESAHRRSSLGRHLVAGTITASARADDAPARRYETCRRCRSASALRVD